MMNIEGYVFLAGASRGVGREIAHCLTQDNIKVKALLRNPQACPELEEMGIKIVQGDALDAATVEQALLGPEPIAAVISTIGGLPDAEQKPDYWANKNLIDAAVKAKVKKFILITSIGTGNSVAALPPQVLQALGSVLAEKEKAEQHLIASGLTSVIIRPGGLVSEPATGNGILTPDPTVSGTIHRADVAQLVCQCLKSDQANHQMLSAIDQNMTRSPQGFEVLSLS